MISTVAIVAFCAGASISLFTLPFWVTFSINLAREGSRSDWIGFAGNIIGASMTVAAAVFAWFAVQLQIRAGHRQTEAIRADAADRRLSQYAAAFDDLMSKFDQASLYLERPPEDVAKRHMDEFNQAIASPLLKEAATDAVFGPDGSLIRLFVVAAKSEVGFVPFKERRDDGLSKLIAPLHSMLMNGIRERQAMLRTGSNVSELLEFTNIDHQKFVEAYIHGRPPKYPE